MAYKPKVRMSTSDRAKQFMPLAALRGLPQALAAKEHIAVERIELTEDMAEELNRNMQQVRPGMVISVVYYCTSPDAPAYYRKITGMVARVSETSRLLQIVNTSIKFDDILEISFPGL